VSARFGCVVLTAGRRPEDLRLALDSLLAQRDVELDVVVVGNGWQPTGLPDGVGALHLPENVGIPAGRNAGVPAVAGELLLFLDDDASLPDPRALRRIAGEFARDPRLGALQPRVVPRGGGRPLREWVPRLRAGDPGRSSDVTALWEGAVTIRRALFETVGGWPEEFGMVHEGVDLAWRVLDSGHAVRYLGDVAVLHPLPPPSNRPARHGYSHYMGARNRVLLARRYLPLPLGALYVASFALRQLPRMRSAGDAGRALRGYRAGMRAPAGPARKLRSSTLWRMTKAGRPPVI